MTYRQAIDVLQECIKRRDTTKAVHAAIREIVNKETVMATPKSALHNALKWLAINYGWCYAKYELPLDEEKVLCCTRTKYGQMNLVLGHYSTDLDRWVCGMNSNVIAWMRLPPLPGVINE